jgi:hypothetical protein
MRGQLPQRCKPGAATSTNVSGAVFITPPPEPVTVSVKVPADAYEAAVRVNMLLPVPGDATLVGANLAVTPKGRPLTERPIAALNPLVAPVYTVTGIEPPLFKRTVTALSPNVKLGAITVSESGAVFVTPPPEPVTVSV